MPEMCGLEPCLIIGVFVPLPRFDGLVEGESVRGGLRLSGQPLVFNSLAQLIAFHMDERCVV
jgi:hypothetical protein